MKLGVSLLASHMLLVWHSQLSGITPPVCLVAYAASAIAESNPFNTGKKALIYGSYLILIPIVFVYTPLLLEGTLQQNLITIFTNTVGVIALAIGLQNYLLRKLKITETIILLPGIVLLFTGIYYLNAIGIVLIASAILIHFFSFKKEQKLSVQA